MSAKDAVMRIESAAQNQGIEEAVDVMRTQIAELKSMPGGQGEEQLALVAKQLHRDGLLPDLAIQFALTETFNDKKDGTFDTEDMYRFQSGKDPLTRAIADNLILNYENLREEHRDWHLLRWGFDWVTHEDLKNAREDISTKRYDFGIGMSEDEKAELKENGFIGDWAEKMDAVYRKVEEQVWHKKNPEVEVQPGDGFDRISRRQLELRQDDVTEADVLEYSRRLAEHNKMHRDTTMLHPGDRLRLPYIELQKALAQTK